MPDHARHPGSELPRHSELVIAASAVRRKLEEGRAVFGPLINFDSPWLVDLAAVIGFDFVLLDAEHGPMSPQDMETMLRAAEARDVTPLVRVPANVPHEILRYLDTGAMGVQVPQLNNAADARAAANAVRYPPRGSRGLATLTRAAGYGIDMSAPDYIAIANRELILLAMVETREALDHIDDIVATSGVDVIAIGPGDLSASMGYSGDRNAAPVIAAVDRIIARAHAHKRWVSLPAYDVASARGLLAKGVEMIQLPMSAWLASMGRAFLRDARGAA